MYFPKSQIITNLYTNGGEFINNSTQKEYKGYYWKTSSEQYFTGKTPQDKPNNGLNKILTPKKTDFNSDVIISNKNIQENTINIDQNPYYKSPPLSHAPISSITLPTNKDYEMGEFQRYFLKKRNEIRYIEIDKNTFINYSNNNPKVQWQLYIPINIPWELIGDYNKVFNINRNIISLKEQELKLVGFTQYFKNKFSQYYKEKP